MFKLHVASAVDANYLPHVLPLARSIAATMKWPWRGDFHVLYDGPDSEIAAQIAGQRIGRLRLVLHRVAGAPSHLTKGHVSAASYLRLALPKVLSVRRVIYLDVDVVVHRDLSALYTLPMRGNPIAGSPDVALSVNMRIDGGERAKYFREVLGLRIETYVNCGVMLMDLPQLRLARFTEVGMELSASHHPRHIYADQDVINAIFKDRITLVDPRWNYIPAVTVHDLAILPTDLAAIVLLQRQDPFITHHAGPQKDLRALGWVAVAD